MRLWANDVWANDGCANDVWKNVVAPTQQLFVWAQHSASSAQQDFIASNSASSATGFYLGATVRKEFRTFLIDTEFYCVKFRMLRNNAEFYRTEFHMLRLYLEGGQEKKRFLNFKDNKHCTKTLKTSFEWKAKLLSMKCRMRKKWLLLGGEGTKLETKILLFLSAEKKVKYNFWTDSALCWGWWKQYKREDLLAPSPQLSLPRTLELPPDAFIYLIPQDNWFPEIYAFEINIL